VSYRGVDVSVDAVVKPFVDALLECSDHIVRVVRKVPGSDRTLVNIRSHLLGMGDLRIANQLPFGWKMLGSNLLPIDRASSTAFNVTRAEMSDLPALISLFVGSMEGRSVDMILITTDTALRSVDGRLGAAPSVPITIEATGR